MRLFVNGATIGITHMGSDSIYIESLADHPPGEVEILLKVDDNESRWNVRLPQGISAASKRVALALAANGTPPSA